MSYIIGKRLLSQSGRNLQNDLKGLQSQFYFGIQVFDMTNIIALVLCNVYIHSLKKICAVNYDICLSSIDAL